MAKQDVLDAINATIVPNGNKAINADSLRNLLLMMTENAGEGGSGNGSAVGGVKVYVLDPMSLSDLGITDMTPDIWAEFKTDVDAEMPGFSTSSFAAAMDESFTANATAFQTLMSKANNMEATYCIIDMGELISELRGVFDPSMAGMYQYSIGVLASVMAGSLMGGVEQIVAIYPHDMDAMMGDSTCANQMLLIFADGSYFWATAVEEGA